MTHLELEDLSVTLGISWASRSTLCTGQITHERSASIPADEFAGAQTTHQGLARRLRHIPRSAAISLRDDGQANRPSDLPRG